MTKFRTDPRHPRAIACCDRCGFVVQHSELRWQMEWTGRNLVNLRLLVCSACYDVPNQQLRTPNIAPDPVPVKDPRPDPNSGPMPNVLITESGLPITDDTGAPLVKENGS